jgi:hypothetical protein
MDHTLFAGSKPPESADPPREAKPISQRNSDDGFRT